MDTIATFVVGFIFGAVTIALIAARAEAKRRKQVSRALREHVLPVQWLELPPVSPPVRGKPQLTLVKK